LSENKFPGANIFIGEKNMANIFAITTVTDVIKADAAGTASAVFTVTNSLGRSVRGIAGARALENTQQNWLDIEGETERDFPVGGTQQFTVNFHKPAAQGGTAVKFPFRLDVASSSNPDEEFTEGPTVTVEIVTAVLPAPAKSSSWWLILAAAAIIVLVGGSILFLVFSGKGNNGGNANVQPSPTPGQGGVTGTWINKKATVEAPVTRMEIEQTAGSDFNVVFASVGSARAFGPINGRMVGDGVGEAEGPIETGYVIIQLNRVGQDQLAVTVFFYANASGPQGVPVSYKQTLTKQ
jgi:hypothetical protein